MHNTQSCCRKKGIASPPLSSRFFPFLLIECRSRDQVIIYRTNRGKGCSLIPESHCLCFNYCSLLPSNLLFPSCTQLIMWHRPFPFPSYISLMPSSDSARRNFLPLILPFSSPFPSLIHFRSSLLTLILIFSLSQKKYSRKERFLASLYHGAGACVHHTLHLTWRRNAAELPAV